MAKLGELYTDFFRIDLDAPGGYARVADVVARQGDGTFVHRAFKLMRHDLDERHVGLQRFENELKILAEISKERNAPSAITRIYDSGFAEAGLSKSLHKLQHKENRLDPIQNVEIVSTGLDVLKYFETKTSLMAKEPDRWLPYLVVDLAPYDDSLLRQIKAQSDDDFTNLYGLPVNTIVEMALQTLDALEYLHKTLHYAYIDWKPEHIYWNEASRQLKLIDWNVTTRLSGGPEEKQVIREDLRMFSGAALYCSLALTDPEELTKPIGPAPKVSEDMTPRIPPRYWTDNPNFYQRGEVLDEKIKLLIQKALDPSQGFNSTQELKSALVQYARQMERQHDEQVDKKKDEDLTPKMPFEAVQRYRRARSYIAAEDYSLAAVSLEIAIATAREASMSYPDAEKLLVSVNDILRVGEFKKKVKLALELEQWKDALNLYNKALTLDPRNVTMRKELDGLERLLSFEADLKQTGMSKIFFPIQKLQSAFNTVKSVMNPDNPRMVSIQKQLHRITQIRITGIVVLLLLGFIGFSYWNGMPESPEVMPTTTTVADMPTGTFLVASTETPIVSITSTITSIQTVAPAIALTSTLAPTPTSVPLAYGKLLSTYFKPYDKPNENIMDNAIERNQPLVIISKQESYGALWYECVWEKDGVTSRGWILAEKIKIVNPPTPTVIP